MAHRLDSLALLLLPPSGGIALGGARAARSQVIGIHPEGGTPHEPEPVAEQTGSTSSTRRCATASSRRDLAQHAEKLEIAQQLARLEVDVIEAGFPITSPGDFEAVQAIARSVEGPVDLRTGPHPQGRHRRRLGGDQGRARPRIHTFISTSDIHIEHQLQTTRDDVKGQAKAAVALARSYCDDVEFSPMDATRADVEFTAEVCAIAVDEGATVSTSPTRSATRRRRSTPLFRRLYRLVPGCASALSVHCHDDLGLAVANSYAGRAGRRAPGRVRGQRHRRAGRQLLAGGDRDADPHPRGRPRLRHRHQQPELARTSRMVSRLTGYAVQPNKAIVGRNAFAHESGIHQDGVLKERTTYEIMDATEVGLESNPIVLGKHSGRHALRDALEELGFKVDGGALNSAFKASRRSPTARSR